MNKIIPSVLLMLSAVTYASPDVTSVESIPQIDSKSKSGFHGQVGLGAANLPEYVGGDDNETIAVPLVNVSYNDTYYFKFNRLGAWAFKSKSGFRVGGLLTNHRGYDKGDGDLLEEDRDDSIMAGLNGAYQNGKFFAEIGYLTDVSDNSDGSKFYVLANYALIANKQYSVRLSAKIENLDEDMVDYYYDNDESAMNATLSVIGTYQLSRQWSLIGAISATSLADEISDSRFVEDDKHNMALIGALYSF